MTALVHEVWRGAIASKEINSKSSNMVDVKFVLPGTVGGFTAREAALIDDEGDMIAVCNLPDTEKAAIEDGIAAALTILMHIVMTNSDALTFTLDPTTDTASAVCVAFTIPHEAWQSAGGAEDDEGGGTYPCRADVVCDEATAMHTPIATLDKACLAAAKACELCPTVETASGVLRFWAMKVPDGELTGSVLLVGQGGGGKSGDGSYTLPTATPFRLGGVKVGEALDIAPDGTLSAKTLNDKIAAAVAVKSEPRLVWNYHTKSPTKWKTYDVSIPDGVDYVHIKTKCDTYTGAEFDLVRGCNTSHVFDTTPAEVVCTMTFQAAGTLHVQGPYSGMSYSYAIELWLSGYHYPTLADLLTQVTAVESSVTDLQVALCELYEEKEEN